MNELRRRDALGLVAAALAAPRAAPAATADAPPLPRQVQWPEQVSLLDGGALTRAQLQARPAVVVFWASDCPFCRNHNRHVEHLQRAAAGTDLLVLGVSIDASADTARAHARQQGYTFPITMDARPMAAMFDTRRVIPRTYGVARGGRLVSAVAGEMFDEDVMELLQLAKT